MTLRPARRALALLLLLAAAAGAVRRAGADEPWEDEARAAEQEEDRVIADGRRNGSLGHVVTTYEGRLGRNPTPLNRYLLARAQYHAGNPEGALENMEAVVQAEPRFWFAHLRLAILYWGKKDAVRAKEHLQAVRALRPDDSDERKLTAEIAFATKDWDAAIHALDSIVTRSPEDDAVRHSLAQTYLAKGDWASGYREMRFLRGRQPKDTLVRWNYAFACFKTDRLKEAAQELEVLAKGDAQNPQYLDLLQVIYARLEDRPALISALERLVPLLKPEDRAKAGAMLDRLRSGGVAAPPDAEWKQDALSDLIERCTNPNDVEGRRKALQEFLDQHFDWVPRAIYIHYAKDAEPDPACRAIVLRILASIRSPATAKLAGHALLDEESTVRRVAAETLGAIGTPAGLEYLEAYLGNHASDPLLSDAAVEEFNAVRSALEKLTGFRDLPVGADPWVPATGRDASVKAWMEWLASPNGVEARVRAIADLETTGEPHPEWYLVVQIVIRDVPPPVVRAAYEALRRHAEKPAEDPVAKKMLPLFPKATEADLAPEGLTGLRDRVSTWWKAWLAERNAETPR